MEKISTHDLLLLHAYGETNPAQQNFLETEMASNPLLQQEFENLLNAQQLLNKAMKRPSETSVRIIMEHSHKTEHLQEI